MKVRIQFSKQGALKFISHLDVMRYFQKAIRRAGIDIAYTTGYSPHQIMSFASPLGLGLESVGEYMDIEVHSHQGAEAMRAALNAVMAPGIEILSVGALPQGAKKAMSCVAAAEYMVRFRPGWEPDFPWGPALERFYEKETIPYEKTTKKGRSELVDLKPGIHALTREGDGIRMLVDAGSFGNIRPQMVLEAFYAENGRKFSASFLEIMRMELYMDAGFEGERKFLPLRAAGEDF